MGRQIEYYMELESYKLLVKKAFELGFKVIEGQNNIKVYNCFDYLVFPKHHLYFYLEEAGKLIINDNGYLDLFSSTLIESGFSFINGNKKEITKSRLWVSSGSWSDNETFIQRDEVLVDEFSRGIFTHLQKSNERVIQLKNILNSNELGSNDLDIAEALLDDLEDAINLFK